MSFDWYLENYLDYNYEWVTEKTLRALGKLSDLKVLNISKNNFIKMETTYLPKIFKD